MYQEEFSVRSEAAIDYIDTAVEQSDTRGGRRYPGRSIPASEDRLVSNGQISIFSNNYLLPKRNSVHNLPLEDLQSFARYLFDITVQPEATFAVSLDHFEYWAWTAAVAANRDGITVETGNLEALIHFASFPIRVTPSSLHPNPAIGGLLMRRWNLIQVALFPVLEGFLTEYVDAVSQTETSTTATRPLPCTWAPSDKVDDWDTGDKVVGYTHLIQIWREYGTKSRNTKSALDKINDLQRYDMESIRWKFDESDNIINEEISDGTYNFLRVITSYRNVNLHGQAEAYRVAPLVLTLCCMVIWDLMEDSEYQSAKDFVIQGIQHRLREGVSHHPFWPISFYPLSTTNQV